MTAFDKESHREKTLSLDAFALGTDCLVRQIPLQQRVVELVAEVLGRFDAENVSACASLTRNLRADALDKIEIIQALEDAFNINISDLDAERIDTVRDAVDCVFYALNRQVR
jgi:acyl carrier protein